MPRITYSLDMFRVNDDDAGIAFIANWTHNVNKLFKALFLRRKSRLFNLKLHNV